MNLSTIAHSAAAAGALTGALGAAAADYHAFQEWKSFRDFVTYDWATASFRWFQGAVIGAVSGAGLGALLG